LSGRWRLTRVLGRGGMATVYLADDLKHERQVAVKVLRPELAAALGTDRFLREIRIAAQLNHPHIVPLFDSLEVDGRLLYVMPYLSGESLRDRLERDRQVPVEEAVEIARQVAGALAYAHGQGVVHRDIKPENILLQAGQAVVTDFGIARAIDAAAAGEGASRLTGTGLLIGTPRYMSPEQILGDPVGPASDVYSLGCVLFEMLAGAPPFDAATAQALIARHTLERVPSLRKRRPEVSRALEETVSVALAKSVKDRFPTPVEFEMALGGVPVRRPWFRRIGMRRALASAGVAAGLAAAGWLILDRTAGEKATAVQVADSQGLAVLYLDNLSGDSTDAYLVDGITEELIARLGQVERLAVPSRTAVRRFRGRPIDDPAAIGRNLGVRYLLIGSVQRAGSRLRVRMELIRAADGGLVWNRPIDLEEGDVLALTDLIAQPVAREVVGQLAPEDLTLLTKRPSQSREAYDHYLRGNFYLTRRTSEADGRRALEEYKAALALDSMFAAPRGRMGLVYGIYASFPWIDPGPGMDSMMTLGLAAANRAIELDSSGADGWLARGFLLTPAFDDPDAWRGFAVAPLLMNSGSVCRVPVPDCRAEAVRSLARAIQLDPKNGEVWYQYGRSQLGSSAGDSALARALELAPDLAQAAWIIGLRSLRSGEVQRALRFLDSAIVLGRGGLNMYGIRAEARIAAGDLAGAQADIDSVALLVTDSVSGVYHGYLEVALAARQGDTALAGSRAQALLRRFPPQRTGRRSVWLALAAALTTVGDTGRALTLLEFAVARGEYIRVLPNPVWDPLRQNPRFRQLLRVEEGGTSQ
jgi:serine/threonine-protein kinase